MEAADRRHRPHTRAVLPLLLGIAFIAAAQMFARWTRIDPGWQRVDGEVVDTRLLPPPPAQWAPVVRYRDADGREHVVTGSVGRNPQPKLGERIAVAYDPADPAGGRLADDYRQGRMTRAYMTVLGAAGVIVGLVQMLR